MLVEDDGEWVGHSKIFGNVDHDCAGFSLFSFAHTYIFFFKFCIQCSLSVIYKFLTEIVSIYVYQHFYVSITRIFVFSSQKKDKFLSG